MNGSDPPPSCGRLLERLEAGADREAAACLDRLRAAETDVRKRVLRGVRQAADEQAGRFDGIAPSFAAFLTDDDRAVRLTTAKLFVTLAASEPGAVVPVVDALVGRVADDDEFYYVRGRCAEALGYVALEYPEPVGDPAVVAELRIGLSFDEPEVREKLAKALAFVALGDPGRLRHRTGSLAEHLDDDDELVRYQLCTALAAVGCEHPETLSEAAAGLRGRLGDENPYVRGRAAEALGVCARSGASVEPLPDPEAVGPGSNDAPSFLTDRLRFIEAAPGEEPGAAPAGVGTVESVRAGIDDVVEEMTAPDGGECPYCGLELPGDSPPVCPRCGAPRRSM